MWECCKDDQQSQWKMLYFGGCLPAPKPLGRFSRNFAWLITSGTPRHTQVLGSIGSKGACLRMREIVTLRRLFFFFFKVPCASLQVGPLDRAWWPSRSFYGFVNKKIIFPHFYPKMWKIALHPIGTLNSCNFGIVEDTYKLFELNRGFSGSANLTVSFKLTPDQPLLPW